MRELRTCPVTGVNVLLNDAWPDRPAPAPPSPATCWACAPTTTEIVRSGGVFAVPHPVPALGVEGDVRPRVTPSGVQRDAVGAHELLVGAHAGPDAPLLHLAAARVADLRRDTRLRGFALLREAVPGAHVAWQLFALPYDVATTDARGWRAAELAANVRVVASRGTAVAIAAWAPTTPFETWVLAREGAGELPEAVDDVAALAEDVLRAQQRLLGGARVNLTVAFGEPWRLVLRPHVDATAPTAAVGLPAHGVTPERAARLLRAEPALR